MLKSLIPNYRMGLYFVLSRERLWCHWACQMINFARRFLYMSILMFIFECVRKHIHKTYACDSGRFQVETTYIGDDCLPHIECNTPTAMKTQSTFNTLECYPILSAPFLSSSYSLKYSLERMSRSNYFIHTPFNFVNIVITHVFASYWTQW